MQKPRIVMVVGTRPDAIKSAPVYLELRRHASSADVQLVSTGQHREMLDQVFRVFGIAADVDLQIMQHGQTLAQIASRTAEGLDRVLAELRPDMVLAQGDTSTTFIAALTAFYRRIPFGHIEAGLRTDRIDNPFPEEFNRRAAALITTQHYAPTVWARENLLREGHAAAQIFVTGNTGIDAVRQVADQTPQSWFTDTVQRVVLLTTHRRENWGQPQRDIARAARRLVDAFDDLRLVVPLHRNPAVRATLGEVLAGHPRIALIEPPDYAPFVKLIQRSHLILTDSGGIQEEAPSFGVPVLVLRETTERPEGVESGNALLVGVDPENIYTQAAGLLADAAACRRMGAACNPYGDGRASARIRYQVLRHLGVDSAQEAAWPTGGAD